MTDTRDNSGLFGYGLLISICLVYLLFSLPFLDRPGLQYDEVLFANAALGDLDGSFIAYKWVIGNITVPLMLMSYVGAVKAFVYAPVFSLFPTSAMAVRLPVVIIGLLTLLVTFSVIKRIFGKRAALIAVLLLATDPSYIFHTRLDWGPVALMMFFKLSSLYFLVRFARSKRWIFLAAGAFFLGAGLYDKANFFWYASALPIAALIVYRKRFLKILTRRALAVGFSFFLLGCWPLLVYNITSGGQTFKGQVRVAESPRELLQNKGTVLLETLAGGSAYRYVNRGSPEPLFSSQKPAPGLAFGRTLVSAVDFERTLLPWFVSGSILIVLVLAWKRKPGRQAGIFFLVLFLLILVQFSIPYRFTGSHHAMMLYPFPAIIAAYALSALTGRENRLDGSPGKPPAILRIAALGALAVLVVSNIVVNLKYVKSFAEVGGRGVWSDAIYDFVEYAEREDDRTYVLMDWGFNTQILLLSRGSVDTRHIFGSYVDRSREEELINRLYEYAWDPANVFVFHSPRYTQFGRPRAVFDGMLEKFGLTAKTVKVFRQRNGDPVYILHEVSPPAAAALGRLVSSLEQAPGFKWKTAPETGWPEIELPPKGKNILFNIDRLEHVDPGPVRIGGWAFIEGEEHRGSETYIILKSGAGAYIYETVPLVRKDVTRAFAELETDYDWSGFIANVPAGSIGDGEYAVGLYIRRGDVDAWHLSDKRLEKAGGRISVRTD